MVISIAMKMKTMTTTTQPQQSTPKLDPFLNSIPQIAIDPLTELSSRDFVTSK